MPVRSGEPPLPIRCLAASLAFGAGLDAGLLGVAAYREPLGAAANNLFFPVLQQILLFYAAALGASGALCLLAAAGAKRSLVFLAAVVTAALAMGSAALAYGVHRATEHFEPFLRQECGHLQQQELSTSSLVHNVDFGLRELGSALARCRANGRPEAITLGDCPGLGRQFDLSGGHHEYFVRLERQLEARFRCAGLCQSLEVPLFSRLSTEDLLGFVSRNEELETHDYGGLAAAQGALPVCWKHIASSFVHASYWLSVWLGLLNAPTLAVAALGLLWLLAALHGREGVYRGYSRVPTIELEAAVSPIWPHCEG